VEKAYAGLIFSLLETYRAPVKHEHFTIEPTEEALRALNDHHDAIVKRRRGELRDSETVLSRCCRGYLVLLAVNDTADF
jgi:hypothetical protein